MKFAYFVRPHLGGTYTVFKQLREGLACHGIEVCWIALGKNPSFDNPMWRSELALGTGIDIDGLSTESEQARALSAALILEGYDGVFINVLSDRVQTNIARYLPEKMIRIMIVHNITAGTYAAAQSIKDHVHITVGVSERIRSDLVQLLHFPSDRTFSIPHAANTQLARNLVRIPRSHAPLRVVFLGRVEDASKGVFWLPDILKRLDISVHLTVAGEGPDLGELRSKLSPYPGQVTFLGAVRPDQVSDLLLRQDVLIMPSRFEGFGLTLTEAMAVGCVPVVSRIRGVTDTIVDDGIDGFLFPIGNTQEATRILSRIAHNPDLLQMMSTSARRRMEQDFTLEAMAKHYFEVIKHACATPPPIAPPFDLADWTMPKGLRSGLRTFIPTPIKNWLRVIRERV